MSETRYISTADTAKLIRKELKLSFPGQKFYVRSKTYSGGASIDVSWMDGPTTKEVKSGVLSKFEGAGFDGMIDLKFYYSHWLLPDGTVQVAKSSGTSGSRGTYDPIRNPKPHPDAELVSFGPDYVFANRAISPKRVKEFAARFSQETGWASPKIEELNWYRGGKAKGQQAYFIQDFSRMNEIERFDRELRATSFFK